MVMIRCCIDYLIEYNRYMNCLGIGVVFALAYLCSYERSKINVFMILKAFLLQLFLAFFVIRTEYGKILLQVLGDCFTQLYVASDAGIQFVFGALGADRGPWGFIFAFKVLPIIVFFGAFMSLLFHWGIIQRAVGFVGYFLQPVLGTSGAETLCAIANSFLGQTEAPLLIRHYIKDMTESEIMVVMVSGMGTISGAILAVYSSIGVPLVHLLGASIMAIPSTILIAKILCPETKKPKTLSGARVAVKAETKNMLDALAVGTSDGLMLALNIGAMLLTFISLIGLVNSVLIFICIKFNAVAAYFGIGFTVPLINLTYIFSVIFAPFGTLFGLVGPEAAAAGELIGIKVAVNEMIAYAQMVTMNLSDRAAIILTYALCGFSNFSCIGIQIGGIGSLAPSQRPILSKLGFRAVLGATLANLLSAMLVGLVL